MLQVIWGKYYKILFVLADGMHILGTLGHLRIWVT